jgi:PKD repeat protein
VTDYSWDFGDGQTGTGVTVEHVYQRAGPLTVTLTVTDDRGSTDAVTHEASPTVATDTFASDTFARTVSGGWGTADLGGRWTTTGSTTGIGVTPGAGTLRPAAGGTLTAQLAATSSVDTDLSWTFASDRLSTGNGVYPTLVGRRPSAGNEYRARLRLTAQNTVVVNLSRLMGGTETALSVAGTVPGATVVAGRSFTVRFQVVGSGPTTLRVKVWPTGGVEPSTWMQVATDSTPALQTAGSVGLSAYLSSSSTNQPILTTSRFRAEHTAVAPVSNQSPTARFTSSCTDLVCRFDAASSSDSDGSVAPGRPAALPAPRASSRGPAG